MSISAVVIPGYVYQDNEVDTAAKRNMAANPTVNVEGAIGSLNIGSKGVKTANLDTPALTADVAGWPIMQDGYVVAAKVANGAILPQHKPTSSALATTGSVPIDWSTNEAFTISMSGNVTISAFNNARDGQSILIAIKQTGAGASTVTWSPTINWGVAGAPTMTSAANKVDLYAFTYLLGVYYGCYRQAF